VGGAAFDRLFALFGEAGESGGDDGVTGILSVFGAFWPVSWGEGVAVLEGVEVALGSARAGATAAATRGHGWRGASRHKLGEPIDGHGIPRAWSSDQ